MIVLKAQPKKKVVPSKNMVLRFAYRVHRIKGFKLAMSINALASVIILCLKWGG